MTLERLADELWCARSPLRFLGAQMGTRMTVVRLPGDKLWLHSPLAIDDGLRSEIDGLGEVAHVVAPSLYHHLFAGQWKQAYPAAMLWGAPALPAKRKDLTFDALLGDHAEPAWAESIDQTPLRGCMFGEVVFFHRGSRTLVTSDLLENFTSSPHWYTRTYLKLAGIHGRPGVSRLLRPIYRDHAAVRASLERMLAWDFERIVLAHGEPIERDARDVLVAAYAWL
ncbi:MAG: DUF4336 domain-containing protein [Deltaproteobacteria bacterium]|nr:DUF4336 domain-containing protein [Nannocystaceae bacterium]